MAERSVLSDARRNRGRRFSNSDRSSLKIHGLVHPAPPRSLLHQEQALLFQLRSLPTPLSRYEYLMRVLDNDEQLFFSVAQAHLSKILPLIYTPTVGDACLQFSSLDIPLRGVWLSSPLVGSFASVLRNATNGAQIDVIVVSDCQRILGLGDLGANGMPIPVGKLLLYSACGGIDPARCLPVVLDVGCDVEKIRDSKNYVGMPSPRLTGKKYDDFVDEFITASKEVFGQSCLIQFEDFGNANASRLLEKYRNSVCCFNDDIQGTAAVGLAGVLGALRIPGVHSSLLEHTFVFLGAGSAGIGIANLIVIALQRAGLSEQEARQRCSFIDSKGLVYAGRRHVNQQKARFAHQLPPHNGSEEALRNILSVIQLIRPTALIGVSTIGGAFSKPIIEAMAAVNDRPIIFALSNPTSKAECTAEDAYRFSGGRAIFASGSPFKPVQLDGMANAIVPGQGNNSYIFPGLGHGIILSKARTVPDSMLLAAADKLASLVSDEQLNLGCVYPDVDSLMDISANIAYAVCQEAERLGLNEHDISSLGTNEIRSLMYEPGRDSL